MKGLLLKDWYLTIKYGKMQLIFAVVYGVIGAILPKANAFVALPVMLIALLPNTIYAYDEREKWTTYVRAFPITDAQYVTGKYLYGAICLAVYFALLIIVDLIFQIDRFVAQCVMFFLGGLLMPSVMMPFMFRFGTEKGRIAYLITFAMALTAALSIANLSYMGGDTPIIERLGLPWWALCLIAVALYVFSWRLSIVLYRNRKNNGK